MEIGVGWKLFVALLTLAYQACTVAYLIWRGKPENSLHSSALSWSYMTALAVLAGLGFGEVAPVISAISR